MRVVLDTNILLVSVSQKSDLHWIFAALKRREYTLCVTTEILNEYAEILEQHMGSTVSENVLGALENLPNVEKITTWYRFNLLKDLDDNKFVDCAIACNAHFIVTHDNDFKILATIPFPKVDSIDTKEFKRHLLGA